MRIPRWSVPIVALLAWLVAMPLAHGAVPWAMSLLARRYGWTADRPGMGNLIGLIPVAGGIAGLGWILVVGLARTPELPDRVPLNWDPKILQLRGPYAVTRNPMYLAELGIWIGWALFYGSIPVLIGFLGFCATVNVVVRREERDLNAQFGEAYREYQRRVRRWA